MITSAELRLLHIIRRVISGCYSSLVELRSNEKPPQNAFLELKHDNGIKKEYKYAPAVHNSSDLSLGFHCNCSQTRDTIPLNLSGFFLIAGILLMI